MLEMKYLGSQHLNSEDIQGLSADILRPHIDDTLQPKSRTYSCRSDSMLAGTGLSNNSRFADTTCQEDLSMGQLLELKAHRGTYLSDGIVDFMRPRVIPSLLNLDNDERAGEQNVQVLTLEPDGCSTSMFGQFLRLVEVRWPIHIAI